MHTSQTLTVSKTMEKKLEASEVLFLRGVMKIPRVGEVSSGEILRTAGLTESKLIKALVKRQVNFRTYHEQVKDGIFGRHGDSFRNTG